MNHPGTPQLATIAPSQLTTLTGGVVAPIYRLPSPGGSYSRWGSASHPSAPPPASHSSAPPPACHSAFPSLPPYDPFEHRFVPPADRHGWRHVPHGV